MIPTHSWSRTYSSKRGAANRSVPRISHGEASRTQASRSILKQGGSQHTDRRCDCATDISATLLGLTYLAFIAVLGPGYQWSHYPIHSDYKPKPLVYQALAESPATGYTTTRTSTTGSPSPVPAPLTGCCKPTTIRPRSAPRRRRKTCMPAGVSTKTDGRIRRTRTCRLTG